MKIWHSQAAAPFILAIALSVVAPSLAAWAPSIAGFALASPVQAAPKVTPAAKTANKPTIPTPPLPERSPGNAAAVVPDPQRPAPAPPPPPQPNLTLTARLAAGMQPLERGLAWRIYPLKPTETPASLSFGDAAPVWSGSGSDKETRLAPGRYAIAATYGLATAVVPVEVAATGTVAADVVLNAGSIGARAFDAPGGTQLETIFFTVAVEDASQPGGWRIIGRSTLANPVFHVRAGRHRLTAEHGYAAASVDVTVEAGRTVVAEPVLNCGTLVLETSPSSESSTRQDIVYLVYEDGAGARGREIARSAADQPSFSLPAGRYRVVARSGLAEIETTVSIAPGQTLRESLTLRGGKLRLASKRSGDGKTLTDTVHYTLHRLAGDAVVRKLEPGRIAALGREMFIASGRYRIESRLGQENAVESVEVEILPGSSHTLTFEHKAAEIKLSLIGKQGGQALSGVIWTVLAGDGAVVTTTQDPAPKLMLKPGTYRAIAQRGGQVFSHEFVAGANAVQSVEVLAK